MLISWVVVGPHSGLHFAARRGKSCAVMLPIRSHCLCRALKIRSLHPWMGRIDEAVSILCFIRLIVDAQGSSESRTQPTIRLSIFRWVASSFVSASTYRGRVPSPKRTQGDTTASNNFRRSFKEILRLTKVLACWLYFAHPACIRCLISTRPLERRSPGSSRPR